MKKEKQKKWTALEVLEYMREHTVSSFRNEIDAAIKEVKTLLKQAGRLK